MSKSVNEVNLIGHLTKDPIYHISDTGVSCCKITVATNRKWITNGVEKQETQYHYVVAWSKLAEICNTLLKKATMVYIKGEIKYRKFTDTDGVEKPVTEIVASDMIVLNEKQEAHE